MLEAQNEQETPHWYWNCFTCCSCFRRRGFFWNFVNPNTIKKDEKAEVTALVENFGSKLKEVRLSDPEEMVSQEIKQVYTPFVSSNFLLDLINDPSKAPGGFASSPWPEKIEIISMEKLDSHTIQ